jgi:hypothetical protein
MRDIGYSFDQRQRLDTLINEIIDPELRKCVTEQAFGVSDISCHKRRRL